MTQQAINLATFASTIWGVAVLGGILFATLNKSTYYRIGIGVGMAGMMTGALMIFRSELFPYAGLVRVSSIDVMLTLVLLSYYFSLYGEVQKRTRTTIIWVVIAIEVTGLIAVPYVQLLDQVDLGATRAIRTERAASRAESEVSRLQRQYSRQHQSDSIQHLADVEQIGLLRKQVSEITEILIHNQESARHLEIMQQQLLLEMQRSRQEMRRMGTRVDVDLLPQRELIGSH